jgi:hypothetical protein
MRYMMKKILYYLMVIVILITGLVSLSGFYLMIKNGEKVELPADYLF